MTLLAFILGSRGARENVSSCERFHTKPLAMANGDVAAPYQYNGKRPVSNQLPKLISSTVICSYRLSETLLRVGVKRWCGL